MLIKEHWELVIVANREIAKGEEILVEYGDDYHSHDRKRVPCFCMTRNCSGLIGVSKSHLKKIVSQYSALPAAFRNVNAEEGESATNDAGKIVPGNGEQQPDESDGMDTSTSTVQYYNHPFIDTVSVCTQTDASPVQLAHKSPSTSQSSTNDYSMYREWEEQAEAERREKQQEKGLYGRRLSLISDSDRLLGRRLCYEIHWNQEGLQWECQNR